MMNRVSTLETKVSEQAHLISRLEGQVQSLRSAADHAERTAARYRAMFDALDAGLCVVAVRRGRRGEDIVRILDANPAFQRQAGVTGVGDRRLEDVLPEQQPLLTDTCMDVARTGAARRLAEPVLLLGHYYEVFAFRVGDPNERKVGLLLTDVTARVKAEAAQREAGRAKDQFLAALAHELRNPLAPLQSGVEVLRLAANDPGRSREATERVLEIMTRQIGHLRHLMDELLDVSRITRGVVTLQKEAVDLRAALRRALDFSNAAIHAGGRRVTVELPDDPLFVLGDRDRLAQVVAALLDNAAKFTGNGGHIRLRAERHGGLVRVRVQDDGVGIDPDMLGEIFAMFGQARTDRHGLGIGLTLVRNLVELHGGTVTARSDGRGRGSEFVVELPLHREQRAPAPAPTTRRQSLPALERQRVLVVDDNHDAADSLSVLLGSMGAEVRTAYDGRSALLLLDELQPQIVFLDIGMPGMDGYEVARRVRRRQSGDRPLLVAVTGWGQPADRQRGREAGFDCHLVKPATFEDLRRVLDPEHATCPVGGG